MMIGDVTHPLLSPLVISVPANILRRTGQSPPASIFIAGDLALFCCGLSAAGSFSSAADAYL